MKKSLKKKLISIFDWNRNKKIDWYEVFLPMPDINRNKKVDWWEALIGIIFFIGFWGTIVASSLFFNWLTRKLIGF